jgi:Tfp pilus assembly protein FimT
VAELVTTVAVMVTLTAISVPMIGSFNSYNAKQASRNIVSQMQLARVHSIKNRVTTVAAFYPYNYMPTDQANSYLIFEDSNENWMQDSGENVVVARTFMPAKVDLSALFTSNGSGGPTQTTSCGFDSQGIAARNGAAYVIGDVTLLQNDSGQSRTIAFNASGKTKITLD